MKAWLQLVSQWEKEFGTHVIKEWLPTLSHFDAANIYLQVRDSFQANWFEEHIRPRLKNLVNQNQRPIRIHLNIERREIEKAKTPLFTIQPDPIDPEMTLENFIAAGKNSVVHKLLLEKQTYNPIFLYGPKGCGKTHLLMGAANKWKKEGKNVFFVKAESFTEHVVQAIRLGHMNDFRAVYRKIDALVVDGIDIFSKKAATQEEFFHTFNTLHTQGCPILLSAKVPPAQLVEIEPRLISRFEWGISLEMERGDLKGVLKQKGVKWNMAISDKVIAYILENCPSDPVLALQAFILRTKGKELDIQTAPYLLRDILEQEKQNSLTFEKIVKTIAGHFGVKTEDILGKSHQKEFTVPRQIAMYFVRTKLKLPYQKIGALFARDHSTVMASVKQVENNSNLRLEEIRF